MEFNLGRDMASDYGEDRIAEMLDLVFGEGKTISADVICNRNWKKTWSKLYLVMNNKSPDNNFPLVATNKLQSISSINLPDVSVDRSISNKPNQNKKSRVISPSAKNVPKGSSSVASALENLPKSRQVQLLAVLNQLENSLIQDATVDKIEHLQNLYGLRGKNADEVDKVEEKRKASQAHLNQILLRIGKAMSSDYFISFNYDITGVLKLEFVDLSC